MTSRTFLVNGVSQHVYLNQCNKPRGTLLFLHGGPGWADAPWAGLICRNLWGVVNTVHWDQRGCNRSWHGDNLAAPLTIEQLVQDGLEICAILRREFQIKRPILVGHSWGAFLGVLMAARAPELFQHYIGIGQLVANQESEPLSLASCKRKALTLGRHDLLSELNAMSETFYRSLPQLFRQREIASELGGEFAKPVAAIQVERWISQSPVEYRAEWTALCKGFERSCEALWPELIERSLLKEVRTLSLPVTVMQGNHDEFTPGEPAQRWLRTLSGHVVRTLIEFENSAHWPQLEENEKFTRLVLERI